GNGHTLTIGRNGTFTTAPLTYRGSFGTRLILDNLTVNVASGTSFASGNAQTIGAVELSGVSSQFILSNAAKLSLRSASGIDYDMSINSGAQLILQDGTQVFSGVN